MFVRPSVCHQTCEHVVLQMNELLLPSISTSIVHGQWRETTNFGGQQVKGQGHTRTKRLKVWKKHHSRPACVE